MEKQERLELIALLGEELQKRRNAIKANADGASSLEILRCMLWSDASNRFAGSRIENTDVFYEIQELERTASQWQQAAGQMEIGPARVLGRKVGMLGVVIHHLRSSAPQPVSVQNELF